MKTEIRYISERGKAFESPEEALEHDKEIPRIIKTYKKDLDFLKANRSASNKELEITIKACEDFIEDYKGKLKRAILSEESFKKEEYTAKEAIEIARHAVFRVFTFTEDMSEDQKESFAEFLMEQSAELFC